MNNKIEEKKILYALAIGLIAIAIAYFAGKEIAKYLKNTEVKQSLIESKE